MGMRPNGTRRVTEKETGGAQTQINWRSAKQAQKPKAQKPKAQSASTQDREVSKADNNISIDDRAEAPTHKRSDAVDTAGRRHNY